MKRGGGAQNVLAMMKGGGGGGTESFLGSFSTGALAVLKGGVQKVPTS